MDLLIKNGTVVTPTSTFKADVGVKDGKIAAIGQRLVESTAKKVVDATGKYVLPGAIDVHTHIAMPFNGTVTSDDYFTGTRAAACGGVTCVVDYAVQHKGKGIVESVKGRQALAEGKAVIDYGFHCAITNLNDGKLLEEFPAAAAHGVTSFKCYMVYKKEGMMVDDGLLCDVLVHAKKSGILTNVHAENSDVIEARTEKFLKEGKTSAWYHYLSRPEFVEAEADMRVIHWAKNTGAPLYIVHLGNKEGLKAVVQARKEGYDIYAETCPHYLNFTCDVYKRPDGRNFVCSPPIKGKDSQDALWEGVINGDIDTVATDHCPFKSTEKDWGKDDFTKIPNGCMGIENLYPYMLHCANTGKINFTRVVEVCSANPAKIFGCTNKGSLDIGKDADIVVYDPTKDFTVSVKNMHSACDYTIWEGTELKGYPIQTYSRGRLVYDHGNFVGEKGHGQYVKRAPFTSRKAVVNPKL